MTVTLNLSTIGDRTVPEQAGVQPHLVLKASPVTLAIAGDLIGKLPAAEAFATGLLKTLGATANLLTGGAAIEPAPGLPDGRWEPYAGGELLTHGTLLIPG